MSRGKSTAKLLLDASQAALFAGIEIHNKPHIAYRYPTAVILIVNAWELALKAYIFKYISKVKIYEKQSRKETNKRTIAFTKALAIVTEDINKKQNGNTFQAVCSNLEHLNEYRCSNVHFYENTLDPVVFMLISKAVLNYDTFLKTYFNKDIAKDDNLIILPVGMKLPFDPIEYLKQDYGAAHNDFVNEVVHSIRQLNEAGIQDSIVVGFNLVTDRVNNIKNADIIAALARDENAVALRKAIRLTDDSNAPVVRIEPDIPPLSYSDIRKTAKERYPRIKFGKTFNLCMKQLKSKPVFCRTRYLDPNKKSGTKKTFYTEQAVDELIRLYKIADQ